MSASSLHRADRGHGRSHTQLKSAPPTPVGAATAAIASARHRGNRGPAHIRPTLPPEHRHA